MRPFTALLLLLAVLPSPAAPQATPFDYDATQALDWRDSLVAVEEGIEEYRFSFRSPGGGRATGRLYRPAGTAPGTRLAGLILGHGAPGNTDNMAPRARYFAAKGFVVAGIDAAFARRDARRPIDFTARDSADQVQTIVDLRRLVDAFAARPDVDAHRLAYLGISYGGAVGGALAGIEPRIGAFILAVGDLGFAPHFKAEDGGWMRNVLGDIPDGQLEAWERAMQPVSGTAWFPRADGRKLFLQSNTQDEAVLPHVARAFHAAAPSGTRIQWYESGHRLTAQHYVDQLRFLHEMLGTPAPTDADASGPRFPVQTERGISRPAAERPR
jgi:hypothetical protein